jgi:drug/metabolite transporter (DMT)-like permease
MSQVVLSVIPILALLLAVMHGIEGFRWQGLLGAVLALAGVAIVFGERLGTAVPPLSLIAILGGAVAIAEGTVVVKLLPGSHPVAGSAVAMAVGAVLLVAASLAIGERWSLPATAAALGALAYLVVIGSVVVFVLFLLVVTRWTASATSYVWPLLPLVAVPVSALVLRERVTPLLVVGGALVVAGVYVGAFAPPIWKHAR